MNQTVSSDAAPASTGKHLVIALVLAAVIVLGARQLTDRFALPAKAPVTATKAQSEEAPVREEPATEDDQKSAELRQARIAREQALIAEDRARREQKKAEVMRARDEAAALSQAEEARKDAAWQRAYVPSKRCNAPPDDATRIDCSNQYLRAKERFEKNYAEGKAR